MTIESQISATPGSALLAPQDPWLKIAKNRGIIRRLISGHGLPAAIGFMEAYRNEPDLIEDLLASVINNFRASGQVDQLVEYLLSSNSVGFQTLACAQLTGESAESVGRRADFVQRVRWLKKSGYGAIITMGKRLPTPPGDWLRPMILALKFVGLPPPDDLPGLFENASRMADRIHLDFNALAFLYGKTGWPRADFAAWSKKVREACAIDEMLGGFRALEKVVVSDSYPTWPIEPKRGTVFLVHHGGFMAVRLWNYVNAYKNGMVFSAKVRNDRSISASENPRSALFTALKGLMKGQPLYIGMDASLGDSFREIMMLGLKVPLGVGPAYLAYEAKAPVVWYDFERSGDQFVPVYHEGPRRGERENFQDYSDRFFRFVQDRLEAQFTGDPANISLKHFWIRRFAEANLRGETE